MFKTTMWHMLCCHILWYIVFSYCFKESFRVSIYSGVYCLWFWRVLWNLMFCKNYKKSKDLAFFKTHARYCFQRYQVPNKPCFYDSKLEPIQLYLVFILLWGFSQVAEISQNELLNAAWNRLVPLQSLSKYLSIRLVSDVKSSTTSG